MIAAMIAAMICGLASCSSMDDNYEDYINRHTTYAEKLSIAETGYMSVPEDGAITLYWTLPTNRIEGVEIIRRESTTVTDTVRLGLVEEYTFRGLAIQSHEFSLYTIDVFGNRSVPVTVTLIPLHERNGDAERVEEEEE